MILAHPLWLFLAVPLGLSLWLLKAPSRLLQVMRIVLMTLIILGMCGLSIVLPSRRGTVVVVADRSKSMPPETLERQSEAVDLIQSGMSPRDKLAVVSFGRRAVIEQFPQSGAFSGFAADIDADASDLATAIEMAVSLIPQHSPGRILLLSDGRWTGSDPTKVVSRAATSDIAVDYRLLERPPHNDLAIVNIDAPQKISPGESFMIHVWLQSPLAQEVSYELVRGSRAVAAGNAAISSGLTRLTFRDRATEAGVVQYRFDMPAHPQDPVPENNTARMLLGVHGRKPLLCVSGSVDSGLADLLAAGGLEVDVKTPSTCTWALEDLANYAAVLLEDVPAAGVGEAGMENMAAWVKETGAGLMMTGGKNAYGPGGYFKSPLEPIMPVSMELRKEHRKLSLAIVVAMDRSGSMAASVAGGKTKMDLANVAAVEVLDLLSGMDEFGVVAVDSSPHVIVELSPVEKAAKQRNRILSIDSMGGGIFVYEALSQAARMLASATAGTRHIILFADAADSEQPGEYVALLEKCTQAGMTVSVIGLGSPADVDAGLLEDIARRGGGRCFFTNSPEELPRLFAQDTFVVARSAFLDEPVSIKTTAALAALTSQPFDISHQIGGYNLCYLRPGADCGVVSLDEYGAPIVASWHVGIGRALCYTAQADGEFTGEIANWDRIGSFLTSLARWVTGEASDLGPDMLLTQEVRDGICVVKLHLNPERGDQPLNELPEITTLRGIPGAAPDVQKTAMHFHDADTLIAEIPLQSAETLLSTVAVPGATSVTLPPVCLPYSPEFRPDKSGRGRQTIAQIAKLTGGCERIDLGGIWRDLPRQPQLIPVGRWLLLAAVALLLAEVLERRSGALSGSRAFRWVGRSAFAGRIVSGRGRKRRAPLNAAARPAPTAAAMTKPVPDGDNKSASGAEPSAAGLLGALSKAQHKARARTIRKP